MGSVLDDSNSSNQTEHLLSFEQNTYKPQVSSVNPLIPISERNNLLEEKGLFQGEIIVHSEGETIKAYLSEDGRPLYDQEITVDGKTLSTGIYNVIGYLNNNVLSFPSGDNSSTKPRQFCESNKRTLTGIKWKAFINFFSKLKRYNNEFKDLNYFNRLGSDERISQYQNRFRNFMILKGTFVRMKEIDQTKYLKDFTDHIVRLENYSINNNELFKQRNVNKVLIVIVSSDKGLCGSFNSSLIKEFNLFCNNNNFNTITVLPIGKKAYDFFKNSNFDLILDYWEDLNDFSYEKSSEICDFIISNFIESRFDKVSIIYNEFKNVAVQKTVSENFLPVIQEEANQNDSNNNYIFEPQKNKIIDDLIPQTLKTQLLKSVLESNASEQGSRMTAMSQATDNAGELLKELKLTYNRSRQAAITKEILEIVGGAEALNN